MGVIYLVLLNLSMEERFKWKNVALVGVTETIPKSSINQILISFSCVGPENCCR